MIADEKILLRQLKEGSHQAFQRLYESYFEFGIVILELYPKNPLKHGYSRLERMK